jgi:hypothetical protein
MSTVTLKPVQDAEGSVLAGPTVRQWLALGGMATGYLALFFFYYPCTHGIEDEVGYINQGIIFSRGAVSAEGAGFEHHEELIESGGRHVGWRNPGRSLVILPFLMTGSLKAIFLSGAVIHLLVTLAAALTLARLGRSPLWAGLVLCHPTLAIYSRTIMGDEPAALGLTCALLAFIATSRPGWWAGVAIGLAAVMRYQAGLTLPFFALAILTAPHVVRPRRQALYCLLSGGIIGAGLVAYNLTMFGNLSGWVHQGSFALSFVPRNFTFFATALCIVWPLMLPALVLDRSPLRWAARAVCVPLFLLMLAWHEHDKHAVWAYTLVIGQRYLIPVLPAWIILYVLCLGRVLSHARFGAALANWSPALAGAGCLALLGLLAGVFQRHDAHLRDLLSAREEMARAVPAGSLVIGNYQIEKLFAVPWPGLPGYRWVRYEDSTHAEENAPVIRDESQSWYLALLPKTPDAEQPELLHDYVIRYQMTRVPTRHPTLILYKAEAEAGRVPSAEARATTPGADGDR